MQAVAAVNALRRAQPGCERPLLDGGDAETRTRVAKRQYAARRQRNKSAAAAKGRRQGAAA